MKKKNETVLWQNKYRSYQKFNTPENFNFIPIDVGHVQCPPGYVWTKPENRITIHYIYSGKGVLEKDGKVYHLSHGDAFVFDCHEPVKYTADIDDPWHYYWIHFQSANFLKKLKTIDSPVFKTNNVSAFVDSVARGECGTLTSEFVISKLYLLLDDIFVSKKNANIDLATEAAICINDNYSSNLTAELLANHFGVSRNHFSMLFKQKHGISVKQYIIRIRFSHANDFLQKGMSVKEAAYLCGYSDQLAFSKMFKKIYGVTPKSVYNDSK